MRLEIPAPQYLAKARGTSASAGICYSRFNLYIIYLEIDLGDRTQKLTEAKRRKPAKSLKEVALAQHGRGLSQGKLNIGTTCSKGINSTRISRTPLQQTKRKINFILLINTSPPLGTDCFPPHLQHCLPTPNTAAVRPCTSTTRQKPHAQAFSKSKWLGRFGQHNLHDPLQEPEGIKRRHI
jgi:hypothetical protein